MLTLLLMATFYIANGGNDASAGTSPGTAWQTIGKVNGVTQSPGDNYYFNGGDTFTGVLNPTTSGTSGNPITFGSYGTGKATISCGNQRAVYLQNVSYITVQDIIASGVGVSSTGVMSDASQNYLYAFDVESTKSSGTLTTIKILRCQATGVWGGVFVHCDAATTPVGFANVEIGGSVADPYLCHEFLGNGIFFYGSVAASSSGSPDFLALNNGQHTSLSIHHFQIYNGYGTTAALTGFTPGVGTGNVFPGAAIVISNSTTGTVQYGYAHDVCAITNYTNGGGVGIMTLESDSITVENCEVHHVKTGGIDGLGIDFDGGSTNCICQYTYVHDCVASPYGCGTYPGSHSTDHLTYSYNICENNGGTNAVDAFNNLPTNVTVTYNTFNHVPSGAYGAIEAWGNGWVIKNNIIISTGLKNLCAIGPSVSGALIQGNWYQSLSNQPQFADPSTTYTSLASFRGSVALTVPPETLGGVNVGHYGDPQLKNIGNGGSINNIGTMNTALTAYDPTSGSSATSNAGVGSTPTSKDFHQFNSAASFVPVGAVYANESQTIGISRTRLQVGM